ncbi:MAG: hypothetical protein ACLQHF_03005 [Terracidiphilus sp.]
MSKYDPLRRWLKSQIRKSVTLTFSGLEGILGFELPASARCRRAWWGNEKDRTTHSQCGAWLDAGFEVEGLDFTAKYVRFLRVEPN